MKQNGITLISLVVTIIVLIILAGISINTLVGENGIITKTKQAKQNIILAGDTEAIQLNQLYYELEVGGALSEDEESTKKDEMIRLLQKQIEELKIEINSLQEEIEDVREQMATKDTQIANLKKEVSEKETKLQKLQNECNNLEAELTEFKTTIASAITEKGIPTSSNDSLNVMQNNIRNIKTFPKSFKYVINDMVSNGSSSTNSRAAGYTATNSGIIAYSASAANDSGSNIYAKLNGTTIQSSSGPIRSINGCIKVNKGDYFYIYAYGVKGSTSNASAYITAIFGEN